MSTRTSSSRLGNGTSANAEVNVWPTDAIERTIIANDIRVVDLHINKALDLLMVVLNTRDVLRIPLSTYPSLSKASATALVNWRTISTGYGVHWPVLDEHLSLKSFMRDAMMSEFMDQWKRPVKRSSVRKKQGVRA